jgi:Ca2+-dependent lipid-binding protein
MMDIEETTDAYIRAFISDDSVQETDTHYRCTTGNPNFNYRLKFNVKTPFVKSPLLSLQLWDRDLIKSNDLICEWVLDLSEIVEDSQLTGSIMCLQEKYYEKSLMPRLVDKKDVDGNPIPFKAPFKFVKKP